MGKLPHKVFLACSGGADSMAILDFLLKGRREVTVVHYNHGTEHGQEAEKFVRSFCNERGIDILIGNIKNFRDKTKDESCEEYWRNARYEFFDQVYAERGVPFVMCHNLDDQIENWLFTSIRNGNPTLIPYRRDYVIRPFLLTRKASLEAWCDRNDVPFVLDPGNFSDKYARSYIRKEIVPKALHVNPGLYKVIKKKVMNGFKE